MTIAESRIHNISYSPARPSASASQDAQVKKVATPSLLDRISSLVKRIINSITSSPSEEECKEAYETLCGKVKEHGKVISKLTQQQFNEIYTAYKKNRLKPSDDSGIVRRVKKKALPRPVLINEKGSFILLTKVGNPKDHSKVPHDPLIGKGSDSTVKLAYNLKERTIEALVITKDRDVIDEAKSKHALERPVAIMKKVGAQNAPEVHACSITKCAKDESWLRRYLITPLFQGSLNKLPGDLSDELKLDAIEQILKILVDLEKKEIVHGDIKPENFVYRKTDKGIEIKQIDFERSFKTEDANARKQIGTIVTSAPEVLNDPSSQSHKADVYSSILTMIQLWGYPNLKDFLSKLVKEIPAKSGNNKREKILNIFSGFTFKDVNGALAIAMLISLQPNWFCPDEKDVLGNILKKGLHPDPNKRQSAELLLLEIQERREQILDRKSTEKREKEAKDIYKPGIDFNKLDVEKIKAAFINIAKA